MDSSTTIFASVPNLKDLCYFRCTVSAIQMTHEIAKEVYHCQILCCRDIIKTFSKTLTSPVPKSEHDFYVIVSKKHCETNVIQDFFKWKLIHYSDPQEVTFEIYKICLKYSVIYKLLPVWNPVGEYLCKGQHYSELTDELDAIKFDLDINDEGMFLQFSPLRLKLSPLSLEKIGAPELMLSKFQNTPRITIHFRHQKAYILPSLKQCKLLKLTKEIPNTCKFKDYHVIRDHWKNLYGIVLPRKEEGINFCELSFRGFEERIFVYPEICLQAELPKIIECSNQTEIADQFLENLKVKVPKICGKELSFTYHNVKPKMNFVKPNKVKTRKGINDSLCDSVKSLDVFNYDPKTSGSFSFKMNFDSTYKSFDSNSVSSFQTTPSNSFKSKVPAINSRNEFVTNWLLNSCASPESSQDSESQTSWDAFEKPSDSHLKKRMSLLDGKKPIIRSIEKARIPLSPFKRPTVNIKNMPPPK